MPPASDAPKPRNSPRVIFGMLASACKTGDTLPQRDSMNARNTLEAHRRTARSDRLSVASAVAFIGAAVLIGTGPALHGQRLASDDVEIRRDTFGVPHILADDQEDAGFGFGFAMAEDHVVEIGRRYLQAR